MARVGHGSERRSDARAAAGSVRHGGRAEVTRSHSAVRPPVRPDERPGAPGDRLGRRTHGTPAVRLRDELHRAPARGDPGRRERRAERRNAAADQRHRRSGRRPIARRDGRRHLGRRRAVERATPFGRIHFPRLRRERLHRRGPAPGEDDRRRAREEGRREPGVHPRRRAGRGRGSRIDADRVGQRGERDLLEHPSRARRATRSRSSRRRRR